MDNTELWMASCDQRNAILTAGDQPMKPADFIHSVATVIGF
ncbi:hypothetical protein EV193_11750 [Herbihabitans rhizosphaerae]|uniref:Uncharacterized protein n=1 Tax=Herbihabitans rhizosphaerae TaxID=1872711 RepID=A0A4Q7KC23_9PSEU|nr:hypothetical protein EV193_11750 [Herbihabitans rhizosphaerae]